VAIFLIRLPKSVHVSSRITPEEKIYVFDIEIDDLSQNNEVTFFCFFFFLLLLLTPLLVLVPCGDVSDVF